MISIPIKSGPITLSIRGADGLTPQDLLDQVAHGARLVMYQYALSCIVLSFHRPSDIILIKPGRNRFTPGLRYSLLSLIAGWWALPSGIIFTVRSLVRNCRGGFDLTAALASALHAAPVGPLPRLILNDSTISLAPPVEPVTQDLAQKAKTVENRRRNLVAIGITAAIVLGGITALLVDRAIHHPVALVNGTDTPYELILDGKAHVLEPHSARVIKTTVGRHTARATMPGGKSLELKFQAEADWYDPFIPKTCTIVNADRRAVFADLHQVYGVAASEAVVPPPRVWLASDAVVSIHRPHFLFESFPPSIDAPEGTPYTLRRQVTLLSNLAPAEVIQALSRYGTREDLQLYFATMLDFPASTPDR